ncbi:MAG: thioredoxin, partial [Nanoarchaeota archaeon]
MAVTHITADNFGKEVKEVKLPCIVDFWAEWCSPCRMMAPVFEKLSNEYEGKLKFCKVDTESEQDLAQAFDITGIPCLIVMKHGTEVDRIVGFAPEPVMKAKIDAVLAKI